MEIIFYSGFNKRKNSTLRPTDDYDPVTWTGSLKEPCSVTAPVIELIPRSTASNNPEGSNYAYIDDFNRYYFVNDWSWNNGRWEAHLKVDVLASFRDNILGRNAFTLYASNGYNTSLVDSRLSTGYKMAVASADASIFESAGSIYGCFALNVVSDEGRWGTATYVLNGRQLQTLMEVLSIEDESEFVDQIEQLFAGASINSIISCTWMPWLHETSSDTVHVGAYDTTVQAELMEYCETSASTTLTIPWPYDDWRMSSMYCNAQLFLPYYGVIDLPFDKLLRCTSISVTCSVDYSTGGATYVVNGDNVGVLALESFNIGCNIPVSGMSVDPYGALKSAATGVSSIFSLNFGGTAESAFEAVEQASMPETTLTGAYGQSRSNAQVYIRSNTTQLIRLWIYYRQFSNDPAEAQATIGRPVKAVRLMSDLDGGYVQTYGFSAGAGYQQEKEAINALMDGGVYLE